MKVSAFSTVWNVYGIRRIPASHGLKMRIFTSHCNIALGLEEICAGADVNLFFMSLLLWQQYCVLVVCSLALLL